MGKLKGYQKKYLRGLAHSRKPVVHIGQGGLTDAVTHSLDMALNRHELIKVKFGAFKEKAQKEEISAKIREITNSEWVGTIGHTALFFRPQKDPQKRKIVLPDR